MSEVSLADTPGSHQIVLGIKPGEGKILLSMKISSFLHCQGGERHIWLGPKMSLNFPAPALRALPVIPVVSQVCWHKRDQLHE